MMEAEQQSLWRRVSELWELAARKDAAAIHAALHPHYSGWDATAADPHDREHAVQSVCSPPERIVEYRLTPHNVTIYDGKVGVAHYSYAATLSNPSDEQRTVKGRWTEVYLRQDDEWLMIAVHGGPEKGGV
jgi:hypothetical protein